MPTLDNLSAANALQLLKDGNTRYMEDHMEHPHEGSQHRVELSIAQHPFAIILGCADSRVIPELIFQWRGRSIRHQTSGQRCRRCSYCQH